MKRLDRMLVYYIICGVQHYNTGQQCLGEMIIYYDNLLVYIVLYIVKSDSVYISCSNSKCRTA